MAKRIKIKDLLNSTDFGQEATVMGWVKTFRNNQFIAINDGSTIKNIQAVVDFNSFDDSLLKRLTTGAAVSLTGEIVESLGKGQRIEIKVNTLEILGDSDAEKFPLQPKKHSLEFLREIAHLRFRTNTFNAVFKVRHALAYAVHKFFNDKGFLYLHTPIITASDAEGAGEMFRVTTLDLLDIPFESKKFNEVASLYYNNLIEFIHKHDLGNKVTELDNYLKFSDKNLTFEYIIKANTGTLKSILGSINPELTKCGSIVIELAQSIIEKGFFNRITTYSKKNNKPTERLWFPDWLTDAINPTRSGISAKIKESQSNLLSLSFFNYSFVHKELKNASDREIIHKEDFFGKATNLTVSGQLEGELAAMAFGDIYTFGPTFRAENSNTTRHLAEFWMIEPEMAFYDLNDNMDLAEELLKYVISYALENCADELEFLNSRLLEEEKLKPQADRSELDLLSKLKFCLENNFERITYTEAIQILRNSKPNQKKQFKYLIDSWGADLQSEHERFLVEKHFKKPVILTDYPADIKSFYMRLNEPDTEGRTTVRAMDILFPGIGEIVGGSQREERLEKLEKRMEEMHIPSEEMSWYLDTRRFGSAPHAGFGLGFERLVLFVTGMTNIRDVIPFPRTPKNAEF